MLMRYAAAVAIEDYLLTPLEPPVVIQSEKLSRTPAPAKPRLVIGRFRDERLFDEHVQRVHAARRSVLFPVAENLLAQFPGKIMQHSRTEYHIKRFIQPIIENIRAEEINTDPVPLRKTLRLIDTRPTVRYACST